MSRRERAFLADFLVLVFAVALACCSHHSHHHAAIVTPVIPCPDHDHANEIGQGHHDHDPCKDDD